MGEDEPSRALTTALGTAPANVNGKGQGNHLALSSERYFYFYVKTCIPTAPAPELWPRPPFSSFSSEVSSTDSHCILKTPTRPLCRLIEKFQRTLVTCFHTPVITTKKRVGEHHPEPVYASKCSTSLSSHDPDVFANISKHPFSTETWGLYQGLHVHWIAQNASRTAPALSEVNISLNSLFFSLVLICVSKNYWMRLWNLLYHSLVPSVSKAKAVFPDG